MNEKLKDKIEQVEETASSWVKKELLKLYWKSPTKVQIALAKFGLKRAVKSKTAKIKEIFKA